MCLHPAPLKLVSLWDPNQIISCGYLYTCVYVMFTWRSNWSRVSKLPTKGQMINGFTGHEFLSLLLNSVITAWKQSPRTAHKWMSVMSVNNTFYKQVLARIWPTSYNLPTTRLDNKKFIWGKCQFHLPLHSFSEGRGKDYKICLIFIFQSHLRNSWILNTSNVLAFSSSCIQLYIAATN